MKELSRKLGAVVLTLILLGSTTSWTLEEHYCMGRLVDIAVFGDAHFCDKDGTEEGTDTESESETSCCDDEILVLDGQDQLKVNFNSAELPDQPSFLELNLIWVNFFEAFPVRKPIRDIYPPPKIIRDIQLLNEQYLI